MRQCPTCLRPGRSSRQSPDVLRRLYSTPSGQGDEASKTPTPAPRTERAEDKSTGHRMKQWHSTEAMPIEIRAVHTGETHGTIP
ncbi:hypothetical protein PG991_006342 [Apiospora marii]|uniref:Uncharacterized protein n=1 Tax=Apiospora marii TaxID=335849 RepID=A0ABR1SBQ8_9PEZI